MGKAQDASQVTQNKDPCWKEHKISLNCLDENGYDKSLCQREFENYRNCKGFWNNVSWTRKKYGLYPLVPQSEEERMAFIKKYKLTGQVPSEV